MKRWLAWRLGLLPLLLPLQLILAAQHAAAAAPAQCPPQVQAVAAGSAEPDRGMLWRLRRDGHDSYLFGSLHIGRPAWAQPGPALRQALQDTEVLALELDLSDPATQAALARTPRLAKPLTAALQARLATQMRAACMPAQALEGLHPLLQLSHLTMLTGRWDGFDAAFGQEVQLLAFAHKQGRQVVALERVEDQLQALIPSDAAAVQRSIEDGLTQLEQGSVRGPMRRMALAWARGDLSDLQNYEQWCDCVHSEDERRWLRRLNDERNPQLAARIATLHGQGTRVLAAVGALHMSGPQALPLLLAKDGFEVTRITAKR
jgi:uncharacterized protein YbaP (TraB family)